MLERYVMEEEPPRRVESGLDLPAIVLGNVGDGQPDSIAVVPQLKGVFEPEAWEYSLQPEIDGERLDGSPIELAGPVGADEVAPYTYRAKIPAILPLDRDIEEGQSLSIQFGVTLPHTSGWDGVRSVSPRLEHSFGACSVELELGGAQMATLTGTSAEYDLPSETITLMGLDADGEPAFITAELPGGDLDEVRMSYAGDVLTWSSSYDQPGTIDLTQQSGSVEGSVSVTFPVTDTTTTTLTGTFEAVVDEDGTGNGCVY
jgi:hypothetical protein